MLAKRNIARLALPVVAVGVLAAGLAAAALTRPAGSAQARPQAAPPAPQPAPVWGPPSPPKAGEQARTPMATPTRAAPPVRAAAASRPAAAAVGKSTTRFRTTRGAAAGYGPLPPLLPPLEVPRTTASALSSPPPPAVLRLVGVIHGTERLALLRRGESRWLAREGDAVDGYSVVRIAEGAVVLQRGSRTRTLRLGQP